MGMTKAELKANRTKWRHHIDACKKSGLSQTAYCREHHLNKSTFFRWKKKLSRMQQLSTPVSLVPIQIQSAHSKSDTPINLVIDNRYRVELSNGFDPDGLKNVLDVLSRYDSHSG